VLRTLRRDPKFVPSFRDALIEQAAPIGGAEHLLGPVDRDRAGAVGGNETLNEKMSGRSSPKRPSGPLVVQTSLASSSSARPVTRYTVHPLTGAALLCS
jgi:hypothetical protein